MAATITKPKGRTKGSKNKVTATVKDNFLAVFTRLGGTAQMAKWANENQTEFYKLYGRLIPVEQKHSGGDGDPIRHNIEIRIVDPKD